MLLNETFNVLIGNQQKYFSAFILQQKNNFFNKMYNCIEIQAHYHVYIQTRTYVYAYAQVEKT